jgi:hypothetical protein
MKTHILCFIGLISLISILSWAPPGLAYYPPCQAVTGPTVSSDGSQVTFSVHDPARNINVAGSWDVPKIPNSGGSYYYIVDLLQQDHGIVAWVAFDYVNGPRIIGYSTYDPYLQKWQTGTFVYNCQIDTGPILGLSALDGIVYCNIIDYYASPWLLKYYIATYDPGLGAWQSTTQEFNFSVASSYLVSSNGVVAFVDHATPSGGAKISYAIYDPLSQQWKWGSDGGQPGDTITAASIISDSGSVTYTKNGGYFMVGYSVLEGAWVDNYWTDVCAAFVAQPTRGNPPLTVWVTDMSIGAPDSFSNYWGDGNGENSRSYYHKYTGSGKYTLTHWVSRGPAEAPPPGGMFDYRTTVITTKAGGALAPLYLLLD